MKNLAWFFFFLALAAPVAATETVAHEVRLGAVTLRIALYADPASLGRQLMAEDAEGRNYFPSERVLVDRLEEVAVREGGREIFVAKGGGPVIGYWFRWNGSRYQHVRTDIADVSLAKNAVRADDAAIRRFFTGLSRFRQALRRCQQAAAVHPGTTGMRVRSTEWQMGPSGPEFLLPGGWRAQAVYDVARKTWRPVRIWRPTAHPK